MRLFLLTSLTMVAFAANSVLNRLALADGATGPASFAAVRLLAGAAILGLLVLMQKGQFRPTKGALGPAALAVYVLGFSFAYVTIETGTGALILFGGVQVTMFAGALLMSEPIPMRRWVGTGLAFAGLVWLFLPSSGDNSLSLTGALLMVAAAVGWGIYSLIGRGASDPLAATASNFLWAVHAGLIVFAVLPDDMTFRGFALAVVSGAITSGLGYALWYSVLPRLTATVAGVAQLTVPLIATAGGLVLLAEPVTFRFLVATALVLGGVALSLSSRSVPARRS